MAKRALDDGERCFYNLEGGDEAFKTVAAMQQVVVRSRRATTAATTSPSARRPSIFGPIWFVAGGGEHEQQKISFVILHLQRIFTCLLAVEVACPLTLSIAFLTNYCAAKRTEITSSARRDQTALTVSPL